MNIFSLILTTTQESGNYYCTAGEIQGQNDVVGSPRSHNGQVSDSRCWIHTPKSSSRTGDV